jgi:hypothetical protein
VDVTEWDIKAKGLLRAEMDKRAMNAADLSRALEAIGVHEHPNTLKNKIWRGKFSAAFLLQCLSAMQVNVLYLTSIV